MEEEFSKWLQSLPETDSCSVRNSYLREDEYVPVNESEHSLVDENSFLQKTAQKYFFSESENEKKFLINFYSNYVSSLHEITKKKEKIKREKNYSVKVKSGHSSKM